MYVDPRGPRVVAMITFVVLAAALATSNGWVVAAQGVVFGIGAILGLQASPYSIAFKRVVRPRLAPPTELEPAGPPRFAQAVGLGFAILGAVGYLTGATPLGVVATGLATFAAFLNAAFGYRLGCEVQLRIAKRLGRPAVCRVPVASTVTPQLVHHT
jgi:MFS family permease